MRNLLAQQRGNRFAIRSFLLILYFSFQLYPQNDFKRFNEYNMQPEVWHFAGVPEGQVDSKGDLNLSLPVLSVPGLNGLDFPINFSYKAGIAYHQQASWLGLGWNFDPGSITRDVQGNMKIGSTVYDVDFPNEAGTDDFLPDRYYVTIPGRGTLTMFKSNIVGFNDDPSKNEFVAPYNASQFYFEEHFPYKVQAFVDNNYNWPGGSHLDPDKDDYTRFIITTDDGTRYFYGMPSVARFSNIFPSGLPKQHANVWRLMAIAAPDFQGLDGSLLQDDINDPPYGEGSWIKFDYGFNGLGDFAINGAPGQGRLVENIYLKSIKTPTHTVDFISTGGREDIDLKYNPIGDIASTYRRLNEIVLSTKAGDVVQRVKLLNDDTNPASAQYAYHLGRSGNNKGKLTLHGWEYLAHDGSSMPGYRLEYPSGTHNPPWYSGSSLHHYDGFGYYDNLPAAPFYENYNYTDADTSDAQAWSLSKIIFPTGGSEAYEYGNDRIDTENIPLDIYYFRGNNYSPNAINQTFFFSFVNPDNPAYSCRYQGGVRVKKIIRDNGMGDSPLEITYSYGEGHTPAVPPKMMPRWVQVLQSTNSDFDGTQYLYPNEFTAMNRGTMDVHYKWVKRTLPDGSRDSSNYMIGLPHKYILYGDKDAFNWALITGDTDPNWGRQTSRYLMRNGFVDKTTYTYQLPKFLTEAAVVLDNFPVGNPSPNFSYYINQYKPLLFNETSYSYRADNPALFQEVKKHYDYYLRPNPTRQLQRSRVVATDSREVQTDYLYAHEVPDYGGDSWGLGISAPPLSAMRKENLLSAVAQSYQTVYNLQGAYTAQHRNATTTTFKQFDGVWQFHCKYLLTIEAEPQNVTFDDWLDNGSNIDPAWQLQHQATAYQNYRATAFEDANGNSLQLFYGSNNSNFSNTAPDFGHAYLTGIKLNNSLSKAFDYDTRFFQVDAITDENGKKNRFSFDNFGRLISGKNPDNELLAEYNYQFSRDLNNDVFDPAQPNFIETILHHDNGWQQVSRAFYDGRAQLLQSAARNTTIGADIYAATESDLLGRKAREYKPYELTYSSNATPPGYDPDYRQRNEDGTLSSSTGHRYSEYSYQSMLDEELRETGFPGIKTEDNKQRFYSSYVRGDNALPNFFGNGNIILKRTAIIDELGNETATFSDALGSKWIEQNYNGNGLATSSVAVSCNSPCAQNDKTTFTLSTAQTIYWHCALNERHSTDDLVFRLRRISPNPATLVEIFGDTGGNLTGSVTAIAGQYELMVSVETLQNDHGATNASGSASYLDTSPPVESTTAFKYDGSGNITTVYPPNYFDSPNGAPPANWLTNYQYNVLGQLAEKTSPDAGSVGYKYDPNGNLRFSQDARQSGNGQVTFSNYDFADRPLISGEAGGGSATEGLLNIANLNGASSYGFENTNDNWLHVNHYDAPQDITAYPWNIFPAGDYGSFTQTYLVGKLAASAYRSADKWQVTLYTYDNSGRIKRKRILTEGLDHLTITYTYNRQGLVLETRAKLGGKNFYHFYDYDNLGQLLSVATSESSTANLLDAAFSYYPTGAMKQQQLIEYSSNTFRETLDYEYNLRDWLIRIGDTGDPTKPFGALYSYLANGNIQSAEFYSKQSPSEPHYRYDFQYDGLSRITAADYFIPSGSNWNDVNRFGLSNLSYDANGNIFSLNRQDNSGSTLDQLSYQYGAENNRLTAVSDAAGNSANIDWDAESSNFSYDANGNVSSVSENGSTVISSIVYDMNNLPTRINFANGSVVKYRYNSAGQRIYKKVDSQQAEHYILDEDKILAVFTGTGKLKYWNIHGNGVIGRLEYRPGDIPTESVTLDIHDAVTTNEQKVASLAWTFNGVVVVADTFVVDQPGNHEVVVDITLADGSVIQNTLEVAVNPDPEPYTKHKFLYIKDHLGSTRTVLDKNGVVKESYDYYPFGLEMPGRSFLEGDIATKEGFTGKERDAETNWHYFGARYYSAALGRWLAVDPLEEYPSGYVYVGNNPIRFFDILGLSSSDTLDVEPVVVQGSAVTITASPHHWWMSFGAMGGASLRATSNFFFGTPNYRRVLYDAEYFGSQALPHFLGSALTLPIGGVSSKGGNAILKYLLRKPLSLGFNLGQINTLSFKITHIFQQKHKLHVLGDQKAVIRLIKRIIRNGSGNMTYRTKDGAKIITIQTSAQNSKLTIKGRLKDGHLEINDAWYDF